MSDDQSTDKPASVAEKVEGALERAEEELGELERDVEEHPPEGVTTPAFLPGEVSPHPSPFRYVMIAVILVVVTAAEVSVSYMEGWMPDGAIVALLVIMAIAKFFLVASWYMHLKTDKPIFRRFFFFGLAGAVALYFIVLLTLHAL
jgi:cytochrome c oxidase subunit IV